ncbi:metallothionein-3 [Drosophila grimshawi]|uniref:metallothionein-3 n=1 Tax=Drosophila grimshawi TaxID=7222 RepID=UPI000C870B7B|nr:metallothionein-3 [Drosophila grimshawi]
MPCVGCEKECKCTAEKCADSCKCKSAGKCGCNPNNGAQNSSGGCCKKNEAANDGKGEKSCCKNTKN